MALAAVMFWVPFVTGLVIGCWVGAAIASAGVLLMVGRRVRHLEAANLRLRTKLKTRVRSLRNVTEPRAPVLVIPPPGSARVSEPPKVRIALVN